MFREENEVESTPTTPAIETPNDTLATQTTATPAQTPGNQITTAVQSHDQSAVLPRDQSADSVARLSNNEQPKEEVKTTKDETKI